MEDAIHDWLVYDPTTLRKCRKCGVYEWWFGCLQAWRRDIPKNMFDQFSRGRYGDSGELIWSMNLKGKFKYVSECYFDEYGTWAGYKRMKDQPEIPEFKPEQLHV